MTITITIIIIIIIIIFTHTCNWAAYWYKQLFYIFSSGLQIKYIF